MTDASEQEPVAEQVGATVRAPQVARDRHRPVPAKTRHQLTVATICGAGAIAAMAISSTLGDVHGSAVHQKLVAFIGAGCFFVLAIVAVQSAASALTTIITANAGPSSGSGVRIFVSLIGYVIVLFVGLGLLGVPLEHLLLGGVLTSVIVGIAAQQALGNVFAGIVLQLSRPFSLGDRIRVRAGALGGVFDGVVTAMSLVYVTIRTDDGVINVPNSTLLAVGVGPAPAPGGPAPAGAPTVASPAMPPTGTVQGGPPVAP